MWLKLILFLYLGVEFVVTQIQGSVDGFERLKVDVDFLFFSLSRYNCTTVNNESIVGNSVVEFESLLC